MRWTTVGKGSQDRPELHFGLSVADGSVTGPRHGCQEELQLIGGGGAIARAGGISPVCDEDCDPNAGRIAGSAVFGDERLRSGGVFELGNSIVSDGDDVCDIGGQGCRGRGMGRRQTGIGKNGVQRCVQFEERLRPRSQLPADEKCTEMG